MTFNCLKNADIQKFITGELTDPIKKANGGESVSPYVKVFFDTSTDTTSPKITVGNKSTPGAPEWENGAVIKSFDMGASSGGGCKIEIIDTQSSSFSFFISKLSTCIKNTDEGYRMRVVWGWIIQPCGDASATLISTPATVTFLIDNIESTFSDGKIRYIITGSDVMQHVFASRNYKIYGKESAPITLRKAIETLAQDGDPKFEVEFCAYNPNQEYSPTFPILWEGESEEGQGRYSVYSSDGQNKLNTIRQWVEPYVTKAGKGVTCVNKPQASKPTIQILESSIPGENDAAGSDTQIIGRYIVNGGACSPVISFSPEINFTSAMAALNSGGNTGGGATGATITKDNDINCGSTDVGTATSVTISRHAEYTLGSAQALEGTSKGQDAHKKAADLTTPLAASVKAQLVIQGDPRREYISPSSFLGRYISLAVLNPFNLESNGNNETSQACGDWTAKPTTNDIFSNKRWIISGVSHSIRDGTYKTTLELWVATPNIELPDGSPLGGPDSGADAAAFDSIGMA